MLKNKFLILMFGILFVFLQNNFGQQKDFMLRLLDKNTLNPIEGANYKYENKKGTSNSKGEIYFSLVEDAILELSHIRYGEWILTNSEINEAIKTGIIFRQEGMIKLQPVTVIALHHKSDEKETYSLDYQDKLSHDGGSILNASPLINSIKKSGSYGFDPVLRGFKYDQLNIVIDGAQCATAACPNRMDPPTSQIAPNMMEFVEVFKGPHSLRYGSSFGGTINFVSASSKFSEVTSTYGRISSSTESNGGIFRTEGLFGLNGVNYDFGLFGSFSKGGNYEDGDGEEIMSNFQRASFGLNLGVKLSDRQQLKISATYNLAQDTDFPSLPMDLISDKTTLLNLQHKINLEGKYLKSWNSTIYGTFVDHLMDNYGKVIIPRMIDAKTDAETISFGGRSEGSWYFENGGLYTGLDLRVEKADGIRDREFLMGPNMGKIVKDNVWNGGQISIAGLFAEYYHFYSTFQFIFSGRVEFNNAVANDINENFASKNSVLEKNNINPSFSIGGLMNLNENMILGLWLGRAQRSGSLTERYINSFPIGLDPYDMLGNPDLKPEINNQVDLTLDYKSQKTFIDLSLFAAILKDYISSEIDPNLTPTMPSSPGVRRFTNIADAFMTGFEISWSQSLYTNLQHEFNLAYTYGKDMAREEPLPEIAPLDLRYSLMGNYFYNKLRPEISMRHVIRQNRISNIFGEVKTPAFTIVDLSLRYQFNKVIGVTFGVQNLLNELYYEHLSRAIRETKSPIYSPGRNLYLSLIVDLL